MTTQPAPGMKRESCASFEKDDGLTELQSLQRCLGLRATLALCAITAVARRLSKRAVPLAITAGAIVMQTTGGVDNLIVRTP